MEQFDETRYYLGTLCRKKHEFGKTGESLRYNKTPVCVACAKDHSRRSETQAKIERRRNKPTHPEGFKPCAGCRNLVPIKTVRCKICAKEQRRIWCLNNSDKVKATAERGKSQNRISRWHLLLWRGSKSSHSKRGLTHNITSDDVLALWAAQQGRCYWTNVPMAIDGRARNIQRPSLDRIDPTRGYEVDNIALSCQFVNIGRSKAGPDETRAMIQLIVSSAGGQ